MAGSLRENLDPLSQHDDATLYSALRSAGLYNISSSRKPSSSDLAASSTTFTLDTDQVHGRSSDVTLDTFIEAGGSNFSLGQRYKIDIELSYWSHSYAYRQIVALARAMVRQSKVLLLDEG